MSAPYPAVQRGGFAQSAPVSYRHPTMQRVPDMGGRNVLDSSAFAKALGRMKPGQEMDMDPRDFAIQVMGMNPTQFEKLNNGEHMNVIDSAAAFGRMYLPAETHMAKIEENGLWPYQKALPRREVPDAVVLSYQRETYNTAYLDPKADRAPTSQLTSTMEQVMISLDQMGKSWQQERGFYLTPTGQARWVAQQDAVIQSTIHTFVLGAMMALVAAEPRHGSFNQRAKSVTTTDEFVKFLCSTARITGAFNRNTGGVARVANLAMAILQQRGGVNPDMMVVSSLARGIIAESAEAKGLTVEYDPNLPRQSGGTVQCLTAQRSFGGFSYLTMANAISARAAMHRNAMQSIGVYDEDTDTFDVPIRLWDCLKASGVLDSSGDRFGIVGQELFGGYQSWIEYLREYECLDLFERAVVGITNNEVAMAGAGQGGTVNVGGADVTGGRFGSSGVRYSYPLLDDPRKTAGDEKEADDYAAKAAEAMRNLGELTTDQRDCVQILVMRYIVSEPNYDADRAARIAGITGALVFYAFHTKRVSRVRKYLTWACTTGGVAAQGAPAFGPTVLGEIVDADADFEEKATSSISTPDDQAGFCYKFMARLDDDGLMTKLDRVAAHRRVAAGAMAGKPALMKYAAKPPMATQNFLHVLYRLGIFLPVGMICARPNRVYNVSDALVFESGSNLGNTFHTSSRVAMSNDAQHDVIFGQFQLRFASRVTNPDLITRVNNVMFHGYVRGNGVRLVDISKNHHLDPNNGGGDVYCFAVPPNWKPKYQAISITGYLMNRDATSQTAAPLYPTAEIYSQIFKLPVMAPDRDRFGLDNIDPYNPSDPSWAVVCMCEYHTSRCGDGERRVNPGCDSIGPAITGSGAVRCGDDSFFPLADANQRPLVGLTARDHVPSAGNF